MKTITNAVKKISLCFTLAFLLLSTWVFSETPKQQMLKGIVIDSNENAPLAYATVVLFNSDSVFVTGAVTASDGTFQFSKLSAGSYKIVAKFVGYETKTLHYSLPETNTTNDLGIISLFPSTSLISEVTVLKRKEQVESRADKTIVNVRSGGLTDGGVVSDALVQVPSVTLDANRNVLLRGSTQFKVMIDGVQSPLDGNEALKSIPVSNVEKLEVITNPSSAYDSEGTAGIINIMLKKEKQSSVAAMINSNLSSNGSNSETAMLMGQIKKLSYNLSFDNRFDVENADAAITSQNLSTKQTDPRWSIYSNDMSMQTTKADATYQLNASNSVQALFWVVDATSTRSTSDRTTSLEAESLNLNSARYTSVFMPQLKFNHKFRKEGSFTTFFAQYNQGSEDSEQEAKQANGNSFKVNMDIPFKFLMLREDFNFAVNKRYTLLSGIDYKYSGFNYLYDYYNLQSGNWAKDFNKCDKSSFRSDILAGYLQLNANLSGIRFTTGLRAEHTLRTLKNSQNTELYNYNKTSLFPSLLVSKQFSDRASLTLSYSRRLNRPRLYQLNPFRNYSNPGFLSYGNYQLKPEFQNTIELGYSQNADKITFNGTLYGKLTWNTIIQTSENDQETMLFTYNNAKNDRQFGAEFSISYNTSSWFSASFSGNAYQYSLKASELTDGISNFQAEGSLNITVNPLKNLSIQSLSTVRSKTITAQGYVQGYFSSDLAISKSFWQNKLRASIKATDIFNGVEEDEVVRTSVTNWTRHYKPDSRQIALSIVLNINKFSRKNTLSPEATPY